MTHVIYLVRHAIAAPATAGMSDEDRPLTAEGQEKMRRAAQGLRQLDVAPDVLLASPLRRAQETAAVIAGELHLESAIAILPPLAPGHDAEEVCKALRAHRAARELMLVGHEPNMGMLASQLLAGTSTLLSMPFKKSAVAAVALEAIPPRAPGTLLWFMTAKQLRAIVEA